MATLVSRYANAKPISVYPMSNWGGIEILDVISADDLPWRTNAKWDEEYVATAFNFGQRYCITASRIDYTANGRAFFRKGNYRVYLDECIKCASK